MYEDAKWKALLEQDWYKMQEALSLILEVTQQGLPKYLKSLRGNEVPYELPYN